MNILYVEDEPNDAQLVALYINMTPHHLTIARNIAEARNALADNPDLILADIMLEHGRYGYDLVHEFHAQGGTCPIIAVTALSTPKDVDECKKAGFDCILHKPFAIDQLADIIGKYTI